MGRGPSGGQERLADQVEHPAVAPALQGSTPCACDYETRKTCIIHGLQGFSQERHCPISIKPSVITIVCLSALHQHIYTFFMEIRLMQKILCRKLSGVVNLQNMSFRLSRVYPCDVSHHATAGPRASTKAIILSASKGSMSGISIVFHATISRTGLH